MSLPPLTLIPAGAGSGKTYTIQQQLGAWVAENKVAPERIMAVTFTEAAAAELRERIGAKLLAMGRVESGAEAVAFGGVVAQVDLGVKGLGDDVLHEGRRIDEPLDTVAHRQRSREQRPVVRA